LPGVGSGGSGEWGEWWPVGGSIVLWVVGDGGVVGWMSRSGEL